MASALRNMLVDYLEGVQHSVEILGDYLEEGGAARIRLYDDPTERMLEILYRFFLPRIRFQFVAECAEHFFGEPDSQRPEYERTEHLQLFRKCLCVLNDEPLPSDVIRALQRRPDTKVSLDNVGLRMVESFARWSVAGTLRTIHRARLAEEPWQIGHLKEWLVDPLGPSIFQMLYRDLLVVPFGGQEAKQSQCDWAADLGIGTFITNSLDMKLALIPPGEFPMGSPESELGHYPWERQHQVRITRPFYLGVTVVTQGEYLGTMAKTPWFKKPRTKEGGRYPATFVTHADALEFCRTLTLRERAAGRIGLSELYRLPTEAEWEYACRAGSSTAFCTTSNLRDFAWYHEDDQAEDNPQPVGLKQPNTFGLHDMHGNVWECCADLFEPMPSSDTDPLGPVAGLKWINRGGGWSHPAEHCRSAYRGSDLAIYHCSSLGFRIVLDLQR